MISKEIHEQKKEKKSRDIHPESLFQLSSNVRPGLQPPALISLETLHGALATLSIQPRLPPNPIGEPPGGPTHAKVHDQIKLLIKRRSIRRVLVRVWEHDLGAGHGTVSGIMHGLGERGFIPKGGLVDGF